MPSIFEYIPNLPQRRPHLRLVKKLEGFGIRYDLGKYCPAKYHLYTVGKFYWIDIKENYISFPREVGSKWTYNIFYDSPLNGVRRLVEYHQLLFGSGIPCKSPKTGFKCELIAVNGGLTYKRISPKKK